MSFVKVGGAALNQTPLDWKNNLTNILSAIQQAKSAGVDLLCLPELCISGYGCEDAFHSASVAERSLEILDEILPHTVGIGVAVGLPVLVNQVMYNAIAWLVNGKLCGIVPKQFLAGQDLYYETRWFKPWPGAFQTTIEHKGQTIPVGDLLFDMDGVKVGFEICEDAWVIQRPGTKLADLGVDVILNASASHFAFDQYQTRCQIVREGARVTNSVYVYSNLIGCEAGRIIYDGTVLIASGNRGLIASGTRFSFRDVLMTTAVADISLNRLYRRKNTNYRPNHPDQQKYTIDCPWQFPIPEKIPVASVIINPVAGNRNEEFARAVSLGLWDYMRKSRSRGFVLSMSGGADSSTVAVLIWLMCRLVLKELKWTDIQKKLPWINTNDTGSEDWKTLMPQLLTGVYQASKHSSETTLDAAKSLCESLHGKFFNFEISGLVQTYTQWVEQMLERPLTWEQDDLALQNIQARVRGPGVWMLANVYGALLLSTSNRSEAAVGYATMDGDTCGGLSPIAGIDKAFIISWLCWMEQEGLAETGPLHILKLVTSQRPTAELRPLESEQSDEADLMPYPLLDRIEKLAIRDRKSPLEVWLELRDVAEWKTYTPLQLYKYVEKFFLLWSRNQWKRERYAPSFHLDDENLDPKTWCRFPILSGGFTEELSQLKKVVVEYLNKLTAGEKL
ncbi:MAG: NAD(+) synthase [SAR324 cluster bacterium]|nr:NAD(+) synthase [SAR324 cluster bacterium]